MQKHQISSQMLHQHVQQLPPACGARQLSKLKRFMTTIQQFAADVSPQTGDHVRHLCLALVNSHISVEEFHAKVQQAINLPMRPFIIPFVKTNLPLLQRELMHCSQVARQFPHLYFIYEGKNCQAVKSSPEIHLESGEKDRLSPEKDNQSSISKRQKPSDIDNEPGNHSAAPEIRRLEDLASVKNVFKNA